MSDNDDLKDITDLSGMETEVDGFEEGFDLDEIGDSEEDEGDSSLTIQEDISSQVRARYAFDGVPFWFAYKNYRNENIASLTTSIEENDWYLRNSNPVPMFDASILHLSKKYKDYETVSAYDRSTHSYLPFAKKYQPTHAKTEGGKGLSMYPALVIYTTASMSSIVNVTIAQGCPASCAFCKESLISRVYTETDFAVSSGVIRIEFDGKQSDVFSKVRVKYFDTKQEKMVIGPIYVPILNEFPIDIHSLNRVLNRDTLRVLQD